MEKALTPATIIMSIKAIEWRNIFKGTIVSERRFMIRCFERILFLDFWHLDDLRADLLGVRKLCLKR